MTRCTGVVSVAGWVCMYICMYVSVVCSADNILTDSVYVHPMKFSWIPPA